jgi:hypothetical protein
LGRSGLIAGLFSPVRPFFFGRKNIAGDFYPPEWVFD